MTLSQRVEELTETCLNDSKRSIGEFVLREKGRIREYSTQQIAEQTCTSKAAVIRFAGVTRFFEDGVDYEQNGELHSLRGFDTMVPARGVRACNPLEEAARQLCGEICVIGDAEKPIP